MRCTPQCGSRDRGWGKEDKSLGRKKSSRDYPWEGEKTRASWRGKRKITCDTVSVGSCALRSPNGKGGRQRDGKASAAEPRGEQGCLGPGTELGHSWGQERAPVHAPLWCTCARPGLGQNGSTSPTTVTATPYLHTVAAGPTESRGGRHSANHTRVWHTPSSSWLF